MMRRPWGQHFALVCLLLFFLMLTAGAGLSLLLSAQFRELWSWNQYFTAENARMNEQMNSSQQEWKSLMSSMTTQLDRQARVLAQIKTAVVQEDWLPAK